jgi:hypothetical protein
MTWVSRNNIYLKYKTNCLLSSGPMAFQQEKESDYLKFQPNSLRSWWWLLLILKLYYETDQSILFPEIEKIIQSLQFETITGERKVFCNH